MLARLLAAVLVAAAVHAVHAAAPPPARLFFNNPGVTAAKLSPDGKWLAIRYAQNGGRDSLAVINTENGDSRGVANFNDIDIYRFQWVNNERLMFNTVDRRLATGQREYGPGVYAINRDGSGWRELVQRENGITGTSIDIMMGNKSNLLPPNHFMLHQPGAQDTNAVYLGASSFDRSGELRSVDLKRVDTVTGQAELVAHPANVREWMLDQRGEPRIAIALENELQHILYRNPGSGAWQKLASFNAYLGGPDAFTPLGFGPDGTFYVVANAGKDKRAVHVFDIASGRIAPEATIVTADFDFDGALLVGDKTLGVHVITDTDSTIWFDARMKAVQKEVDTLLPATTNLLSVGVRSTTPFVLVNSFSDIVPSSFMLFNTDTKVFREVGSSLPGIDPSTLGRQQLVRYKARDGLTIPAWLTLPPGASGKNLPMVVLVHGGPYIRGSAWGFAPEVQFLASRGYAVLEPEFRGSDGYGSAHFRAGFRQWGLAMQHDVADGAKWAIDQGIAAPKRICIAGASYGGYSAMMGLVNDPDLYQCGINWIGVTDIKLMVEGKWNVSDDLSKGYRKYGVPELIGDPVKHAQQFRDTSPVQQAARITRPVLLAYGGKDRRVPPYHGEKLRDALKAHNQHVEWVLYPNEAHGWSLPSTRIDFWTRVENFLQKNIGAP